MNKIKIVHILHSFDVGGIETLVLNLCNMMDKSKYEFHLITLTSDKLRMVQQLSEDVEIHSLPFNHQELKTIKGLLNAFYQLVKLLKIINTDIIHSHLTSLPLLFISTAIKYANVTSVHIRTLHTAGLFYENQNGLSNKRKLFAEKIAMRLVKTHLISVSNTVYRNNFFHFKDIAENITLIQNGIDLNKFNKNLYKHLTKQNFGIQEDNVLISYIARLDEGKNHDFLIEIWKDVLVKCPNVVLCFAGDGVYKERLQEKAKQMDLMNHIIFLGAINNVPELLSVSNFAVFPSSYEGFGLVMIEKFAMGLPIIASDIKSFQDIATNNENAFLVDITNKKDFINRILDLCLNPILRKKMGEKAFSTAKQYSIGYTLDLYDQYYTSCLNKK